MIHLYTLEFYHYDSWSSKSVGTLFVYFNLAPSKSGLTIEKSQTSPTKTTLFQKPTQDTAELREVKQEKEVASLELSFAPLLAGNFFLATLW